MPAGIRHQPRDHVSFILPASSIPISATAKIKYNLPPWNQREKVYCWSTRSATWLTAISVDMVIVGAWTMPINYPTSAANALDNLQQEATTSPTTKSSSSAAMSAPQGWSSIKSSLPIDRNTTRPLLIMSLILHDLLISPLSSCVFFLFVFFCHTSPICNSNHV